MRVGLDFDGVIADTVPAMIAYARKQLGIELDPADCIVPGGIERLGLERYRQLVADTHATAYGLTFQPTAGALAGLDELSRNHDLFVVTAREGASFANVELWLHTYAVAGFFASVRSSLGPAKSQVVDELKLDCFVDDVPRTFHDWSARARPLLWDAEYNTRHVIEPSMERVLGWAGLTERLRSG